MCFVFLFVTSACAAEGLSTLIEVAKSQAEIKKQYDEETKKFERVKKGVESGSIKKGDARAYIEKEYGAPIVSVKDLDGIREDCVYKPAASSFFKGIRATLIYTKDGLLDEARVEEI
jgi:hypothetical protein